MLTYEEFLAHKKNLAHDVGFLCADTDIHPVLFDFQKMLTRWALKKGRAALFASCGLGKTLCQLEWARHIPGRVLIVAPLSVAEQTIAEARRYLDTDVRYVRRQEEMGEGLSITNYDVIKHFIGVRCQGIVLDESSILRSVDGKTRTMLIDKFAHIPYRLCCTATPAPNDIAEITNHAAFLGIMSREKVLSTFFVHDDAGWRLRGHAAPHFYQWITSWAIAVSRPEDLGYDGRAYTLPPLHYHQHIIPTDWRKDGFLFAGNLSGITDRSAVRKRTARDRVAYAADLVRKTVGQVVVWCGLNDESSTLASILTTQALELTGSQTPERKLTILQEFLQGTSRILITKPRIAGRGMNFQCAHTQIFLGLGDSWEDYYQCIRRLWRYGQLSPVDTHIIVSDHETEILENIQHKEQEALKMIDTMVAASSATVLSVQAEESIETQTVSGADWQITHGDCVEVMRGMPSKSIDLSVFSPPFMALYQYTGTTRDVGNSKSQRDFFRHFKFVSRELVRLTRPGRLCCMHLAQVPAMQARDGYIGMKDFRGPMIAHMEAQGWIYHGEVVIQKNPQAQAIRIRAKGLAFQQLEKDAAWMRPALADMVLLFRAPGENPVAVQPECTREEWISWAHPVWFDIKETLTLNAAEGRAQQDDRHIHPLQLPVIERCIRLWSNRGETIFDPFAGIGSTGVVALRLARKSLGIELKESYFLTAQKNYTRILVEKTQQSFL